MFRLDQERVLARLRARAAELVREPDVVAVWLFGSLARGDGRPGSDADLVVVLRDGAGPFLERIPPLLRRMSSVGVGCDVVPYTESEWARAQAAGGRFARTVAREGVRLAARAP